MRYPLIESSILELKEDFPQNNQIIKTIIGFCNQNGGKLIIGVQNDGKVKGLSPDRIEQALESLDKAIYQASHPPIMPAIYTQTLGNKTVLIIEVSSGMNKPYFRKSEGVSDGTYIRLGRHTFKATPDIIQELTWKGMGLDFETLPIYWAKKSDLVNDSIKTFLRRRKNHGKPTISNEMLQAYGLMVSEHSKWYPTNAGILLFGKYPQRFLSEAMIICTHFRGTSGRQAIATVDCEGTLLNQYDQAYAFILSRLYRSYTISSSIRDEELEIPSTAIREALLNAILHRNYHMKSPAKVAIYDNRVEIFSPGQFPGPLDTRHLTSGISYIRNPTICKVFREVGLIEKLGSGFIEIFEKYRERGLDRPEVVEGANYIKCILPRKSLEQVQKAEGDDFQEILRLFDLYDEIALRDVMQRCAISRATAARRMKHLIDSGSVERFGQTSGVRFRKKLD